MKRHRHRRSRRGGFTLIEVLLVLVILTILASFAFVYVRGARKKAFASQAQIQVEMLAQALDHYDQDMHGYPTNLEGLVQSPSDARNPDRWQGPYLKKQIPLDPWDNPYQYELLNNGESFRIVSFGPDGAEGTDDDIGTVSN